MPPETPTTSPGNEQLRKDLRREVETVKAVENKEEQRELLKRKYIEYAESRKGKEIHAIQERGELLREIAAGQIETEVINAAENDSMQEIENIGFVERKEQEFLPADWKPEQKRLASYGIGAALVTGAIVFRKKIASFFSGVKKWGKRIVIGGAAIGAGMVLFGKNPLTYLKKGWDSITDLWSAKEKLDDLKQKGSRAVEELETQAKKVGERARELTEKLPGLSTEEREAAEKRIAELKEQQRKYIEMAQSLSENHETGDGPPEETEEDKEANERMREFAQIEADNQRARALSAEYVNTRILGQLEDQRDRRHYADVLAPLMLRGSPLLEVTIDDLIAVHEGAKTAEALWQETFNEPPVGDEAALLRMIAKDVAKRSEDEMQGIETFDEYIKANSAILEMFGKIRTAIENGETAPLVDIADRSQEEATEWLDQLGENANIFLKLGVITEDQKPEEQRKAIAEFTEFCARGDVRSIKLDAAITQHPEFKKPLDKLRDLLRAEDTQGYLQQYTHGQSEYWAELQEHIGTDDTPGSIKVLDALELFTNAQTAKGKHESYPPLNESDPLGAFMTQIKLIQLLKKENASLGTQFETYVFIDLIRDGGIDLPPETIDMITQLAGYGAYVSYLKANDMRLDTQDRGATILEQTWEDYWYLYLLGGGAALLRGFKGIKSIGLRMIGNKSDAWISSHLKILPGKGEAVRNVVKRYGEGRRIRGNWMRHLSPTQGYFAYRRARTEIHRIRVEAYAQGGVQDIVTQDSVSEARAHVIKEICSGSNERIANMRDGKFNQFNPVQQLRWRNQARATVSLIDGMLDGDTDPQQTVEIAFKRGYINETKKNQLLRKLETDPDEQAIREAEREAENEEQIDEETKEEVEEETTVGRSVTDLLATQPERVQEQIKGIAVSNELDALVKANPELGVQLMIRMNAAADPSVSGNASDVLKAANTAAQEPGATVDSVLNAINQPIEVEEETGTKTAPSDEKIEEAVEEETEQKTTTEIKPLVAPNPETASEDEINTYVEARFGKPEDALKQKEEELRQKAANAPSKEAAELFRQQLRENLKEQSDLTTAERTYLSKLNESMKTELVSRVEALQELKRRKAAGEDVSDEAINDARSAALQAFDAQNRTKGLLKTVAETEVATLTTRNDNLTQELAQMSEDIQAAEDAENQQEVETLKARRTELVAERERAELELETAKAHLSDLNDNDNDGQVETVDPSNPKGPPTEEEVETEEKTEEVTETEEEVKTGRGRLSRRELFRRVLGIRRKTGGTLGTETAETEIDATTEGVTTEGTQGTPKTQLKAGKGG